MKQSVRSERSDPMTPSKAPLPFLGTWKLVKSESSHPHLPHPTGGITTFTQEEDTIQYSNEGIWSNGQTVKVSADLQLDGTWRPVTGSMLADSLSSHRLEDGSVETAMQKGGVSVGTNRLKVSDDGQSLTTHWELAGPGGIPIIWNLTLERQ
jgi:hypothetical protein